MNRFAHLVMELETASSTEAKENALTRYFEYASDDDKTWATAILSHRHASRVVKRQLLVHWACEMAGIPEWLFAESYNAVGDFAETIALIIPKNAIHVNVSASLAGYMHRISALKVKPDDAQKEFITSAWLELEKDARYVFNKLLTGALRIHISQTSIVRALAAHTGLEETSIAARLAQEWDPKTIDWTSLFSGSATLDSVSRPYPFQLAHTLEPGSEKPGASEEWIVERKVGGVRAQFIVRAEQFFIWTRHNELVTQKFPELHALRDLIPTGTILDGQIFVHHEGLPLSTTEVQKRIDRKTLTKKTLREIPARVVIFDILEWQGEDVRGRPQYERRLLLEELLYEINNELLILSEVIHADTWEALNAQRMAVREHNSDGLMLKHRNAIYSEGRRQGVWWKWKADPYTMDCVLIYVLHGQGRNANSIIDITFAVWDHSGELVPVAKTTSGLPASEYEELLEWVTQNTVDRFGPLSVVHPAHVFELHFDSISKSSRHKSGLIVESPRIHAWLREKDAKDAGRLEELKKWMMGDG